MKSTHLIPTMLAIAALAVAAPTANAQQTIWIGAFGGDGVNYTDSNNWDFGNLPTAAQFEVAKIGAFPGFEIPFAQTAQLTTDFSAMPSPHLVLGEGAAYTGTLGISASGNLAIANGLGTAAANLTVGLDGGTGFLNVDSGTLTVGEELTTPTSGNVDSSITLTGTASVTAGSVFLDRNLVVSGNAVSFNVTGGAILGAAGTHTWEFALTGGAAGPSPIVVGGQLDLGGTLKIDTMGEIPSSGDSFLIADSATVINGFANVDVSDVPGIGLGVSARAVQEAGGNGVLTSVVFEQQPVLIVNRQSGEVRLQNPSSGDSVAFDVYTIGSDSGGLVPGSWSSIAPSDNWQQANPKTTALSEINPVGAQSLAGNADISLGSVFSPSAGEVGENREDLAFRFAPDGQGFVNGIVVYEGIPTDTLTLNVDRTTGQAQVLNGFGAAVTIDAYVIDSASDSLDPSSGGSSGLGGDWQLGANDEGVLSELNPIGSLDVSSGEGVSLGQLYDFGDAGSMEDLTFRFALPGDDFFRDGKVVFGDELTMLDQVQLGDFNNDGVVDSIDYAVWRENLNAPDESGINNAGDGLNGVDQGDFAIWLANFGAGSPADVANSSSLAPEPAAAWLLGITVVLALRQRRGA